MLKFKKNTLNQSGFTLIELVTVIGILAVMSLFVFRQFGDASNDSKYGITQTILLKDAPAAIAGVVLRLGSCSKITSTRLIENGLKDKNAWGDQWYVDDDSASGTEDSVTINYIVKTATDAADMAEAIMTIGGPVDDNAGPGEDNDLDGLVDPADDDSQDGAGIVANTDSDDNVVTIVYPCSSNVGA